MTAAEIYDKIYRIIEETIENKDIGKLLEMGKIYE